jgi:hypothetical protein
MALWAKLPTTRALVVPAAVVRIVAGTALLAAPRVAGRVWIGEDAGRAGTMVFAQALGARDALIGLGTLLALREGQSPRWWLLAGAASDAVDALATLREIAGVPRWRRLLVATMAGGGALGYTWLAARSDDLAGGRDGHMARVAHAPGLRGERTREVEPS